MKEARVRICVPVCVSLAGDLSDAIRRAAEGADIIELRLDCLEPDQLRLACRDLGVLRRAASCPLILTLRPMEQGGHRATGREERLNFWLEEKNCQSQLADFVDVEADLLTAKPQDAERLVLRLGPERIICSHHDFAGVPSDLEQIYESMARTESHILKIAVQAHDAINCLPIFHLLHRARSEGQEMIAIAMGEAGIMTRILGPSRGAFLTYGGALDGETATAPGQLTAKELREVYRIDQINQQTDIMGLIGRPVSHSMSPNIQNAAFAAAGVNAVYIPFEVRDAGAFMRRMVHPRTREIDWKLRGLSVTAPHKSTVMQHLDWIEPAAKGIGAVNTIVVEGNDLHGYNTDAEAFLQPLRNLFGSLGSSRCAIIGAGGAARSAIWALQKDKASVSLFARDIDKGRPLAEEFSVDCFPLQDAGFNGFDILVNASPLGTRGTGENETPAVSQQLRSVRLVYDLVYNPPETRLMREGRVAGCEILGGLEMLIAQAAEQFKLWSNDEPDKDIMRAAALNALTNSGLGHLTSGI
jgi:3-dehydroquinate dehydratase/shikimate dehydrogenase